MGVVDTVILFAYLALLIGIGVYAQRSKPDVDDYFVAGRRMGPATIACMWVAAWIGGAAIVGTSARVYAQGITGIWYVTRHGDRLRPVRTHGREAREGTG